MKSELVINDGSGVLIFPLMAKSKKTGKVVLFKDERNGTVLLEGHCGNEKIGTHDSYTSVTVEETWTILPKGAQVILTQD